MNWRHVFNGNKVLWSDMGHAGSDARKAGYRFMAFYEKVYFHVNSDSHCNSVWVDTGLRINDKGEIV